MASILSVQTASGHLPPEGESHKVLSLADMREAIIYIRDKKFPFPTEAKKGNAGSFFKNPVLSKIEYEALQQRIFTDFGQIKVEQLAKIKFIEHDKIKIPAAYLIELCELKHLKSGGAAINPNQPLVIINSSGLATAGDVLSLANLVRETVQQKTGIGLVFEPELIGF